MNFSIYIRVKKNRHSRSGILYMNVFCLGISETVGFPQDRDTKEEKRPR